MIVRADARRLPLADASVDLVVTSPPYYALRSYTDAGEHYQGQIGSEATPAEYIASLLDCTREWVRVLKPSGSIWVNLGDKYAGTTPPGSGGSGPASRIQTTSPGSYMPRGTSRRPNTGGVPIKSLYGLPWRYALACIDQLGLILRAEVIWSKPNGLPESVTDRVRRSHETWFHMVRQPRYFSAVDEIRETYAEPQRNGAKIGASGNREIRRGVFVNNDASNFAQSALGKLPGSVWSIPSEPLVVPEHLGVDHFAAFPTEWPRRLILGWSPSGICTVCGEGRRPAVDRELEHVNNTIRPKSTAGERLHPGVRTQRTSVVGRTSATIVGYACACPEPTSPTRPSVILDPFGGTGTVALVAAALGRVGISVDRSADYCRLAAWRTTDPAQRAKALQVPAPPRVSDDQLAFDFATQTDKAGTP